MTQHNISDEASVIALAADLEKSVDPYMRASARAMRKIVIPLIQHSKSEALTSWGNLQSFETSMTATERTIGIGLFLYAVAASRGDARKVDPILQNMLNMIARSAHEQMQQANIIEKSPIIVTN